MKPEYILSLLISMLILSSCSGMDNPGCGGADADEEHVYSFTAVLPGGDTRMGYHEDPYSGDLKMTWDEGDVIRLYPDPSMNDPIPYYDFIANTGAGTSHTVFVHQGYILNWEHWSGKAIYLFPEGDNIDVGHDSAEFLAKAYVQKKNGDTEHLKYAEHVPGPDGKKQYTEYWSQNLVDANLKHDHRMAFSHPHTVVYKVMLRGFIFDIPGGSQLRMSGDAWGGEETVLTLGSKDDKEPFVRVGEYGKDNYEDNVLTAYIIRQVARDVDGTIGAGGKLKFELLSYDELDGTVMPLDPDDTMRNDNPDYGPDYLTNLPWGDEYTWNVAATKDIEYKAGDFVVADLTDKTMDYAYPKIAVDLGLPLKWAAFNLGANKIDDRGKYAIWGYTTLFTEGGKNLHKAYEGVWNSGDPEHDAASFHWGDGWRTPTFNEFLDLAHYAKWIDGADSEATEGSVRWQSEFSAGDRIYNFETNPARKINGVDVALVRSKVNDKYIYLHIAGNLQYSSNEVQALTRAFYNTSSSNKSGSLFMCIRQKGKYYLGCSDDRNHIDRVAVSVRAVKNPPGKK